MVGTKTVLILGNGFDIAHNLPTYYTDFVDFLSKEYKESRAYKLMDSIGNDDVIKNLINDRTEIMKILGANNSLLEYIISRLEKNREINNNWVDFEQEIAHVIKYNEKKLFNKDKEDDDLLPEIDWDFDLTTIPIDAKKIHEDFYRLLCAFEEYINKVVNKIPINVYSADIYEINPDIVISLNYSNTYERHYSHFVKTEHIHGLARDISDYYENVKNGKVITTETFRDSNHIVMGMDEYLNEKNIKEYTDFIEFRKYFQRITKKTGNNYREVLLAEHLNVYIFGHSIDPTDAELLIEMINHPRAQTTIFYHDENAYHREITNLVRIFGKKKIIEKCDERNSSIILKRQRAVCNICSDLSFEFAKGLDYLNHITEISEREFYSALEKVKGGIAKGRGINSQLDILRAYNGLYRLGIEASYEDSLLKLVQDTPVIDENGNVINAQIVSKVNWEEPTVDGKLEVPRKMSDFINKVNELNREKIEREGRIVLSNDSCIHLYEKNIPEEISQTEYRKFLVQMMGQLKTENDHKRVWNLLKRITVSKVTIGAKAELLVFFNDEDLFKKVVANVLLDFLDSYENEEAYEQWLNEQMKEAYESGD